MKGEMFKEYIESREQLYTAMEALDRLGKVYVVTKSIRKGGLNRDIPIDSWFIEERIRQEG